MEGASAARRGRFPQLVKYELLDELGHGGMATVYRALDKRLGREVAVKVIHPHLRDSHEVVLRFHTEARAVAKLRHPNIVEVFDVSDPDEPEQYLVVELLGGTTLRRILQNHKAMPAEVAAALALELLGALAHAHAHGVIHRDIKPENVLIEHRPATTANPRGGVVVKLTDFGIAKLLDAQGVTSTGQVLGSPAHMAPEQIEGAEVDARADVFGLGVLLYECMVGHLPFEGTNPAQVLRRVLEGRYAEAQQERPIVGSRWSELLDHALAHSAEDRFASANEMRAAIGSELDRLGLAAPSLTLEAWLDDSAAFEPIHSKKMIETLCALGNESRRRGDVLSAAADYNRALAHAPDDAQLLHIVAAMNRAEVRTKVARRAAVALLLMVGLGGVAFGAGRLIRAHSMSRAPLAAGDAPHPVEPPRATVREIPTAPSAAAAPSTTSVPRTVAVPAVARDTFSKFTERSVTLDLMPTMGVTLSIDDEPSRDVTNGTVLRLGPKAHLLTFSCPVCTPEQRLVIAGEKDETLKVNVPIKPATLIVDGDRDKTYQLVEAPQFAIVAGSNIIALTSMNRAVTVRQMETDVRVRVRLLAGAEVRVTF